MQHKSTRIYFKHKATDGIQKGLASTVDSNFIILLVFQGDFYDGQ